MLKDELEAIIKSDNIWAGRSTLVLAIGILGEYVVLPFVEDNKARWKKPLKILFAVLVVAGIVGEYEFSSRIARNADRLQQISDQELGDAIANAGAAVDRAAKAEVRVRELELELAKLKTPRALSAIQRRRIEVKLGKFQTTPYELASDPDPEALGFVRIVDAVLRSSKWQYVNSARNDFRSTFTIESGSRVEVEYLSGVVIRLAKAIVDKYRPAAEAFRDALRAEGINVRLEIRDDDPSPANVHVVVGTKE